MRSPPPAPPPTATGGKRGSTASQHTYHVNGHRHSPDQSRLSPAEKREMLYGPGGVFGPTGPFSTPEISRYPAEQPIRSQYHDHVTSVHQSQPQQPVGKRISFADMVDGKSDQSGFAEDRSDKSQYVSNPVIQTRRQSPTSSNSRVDNYHQQEPRSKGNKSPSEGQEQGDAWVQEKQKRMLHWINKSQVALGARIVGKTSS